MLIKTNRTLIKQMKQKNNILQFLGKLMYVIISTETKLTMHYTFIHF